MKTQAGGLRSLIHHGLALLLLFLSRYYMQKWYLYLYPTDYVLFALLFITALAIGCSKVLKTVLQYVPRLNLFILFALIFFLLPWGEWLRLNYSFTRSDWTRQLWTQTIFLYGILVFFRLFPQVPKFISRAASNISGRYSSKVLPFFPVLFLILTSLIAFIIFQRTPLYQDSAAHLFQAKIFLKHQLFAPEPPVPQFFSVEGDMTVMKSGRWFSAYPPGFAALLSAAMIFHAEWLVCPLLGACTLILWLHYAKRWHGSSVAFWLGILFLFSPSIFLMSSTYMIHVPELFIATAMILLCRMQNETPFRWSAILVLLLMACGILIRGFSIIAFLAPILLYTSWQEVKKGEWRFPVAIFSGLFIGFVLLGIYQWKTTGSPFVSGYELEHPGLKYGFTQTTWGKHTPARGIENTSNNFLGLNQWLLGWKVGALFLVGSFLLVHKLEKWDKIIGLGCLSLMLFYFFFILQDNLFGSRYFFTLAPFLLLLIARNTQTVTEPNLEEVRIPIFGLMIFCLILFFFGDFKRYLFRHHPSNLKQVLENISTQKSLVFLEMKNSRDKVNWNDPFLDAPAILCISKGQHNQEAIRAFPSHMPLYFRKNFNFNPSAAQTESLLATDTNKTPASYVSLYNVATAFQSLQWDPDRDCMDASYEQVFSMPHAKEQMIFLQKLQSDPASEQDYKADFRKGLIYAAQAMLQPAVAYAEREENWPAVLDIDRFRENITQSETFLQRSGLIGKNVNDQLEKLIRRIDRNKDGNLSDQEVIRFVRTKAEFFIFE